MTNATTKSTTIKHEGLSLRKVTGRIAIAGDYVVYKHNHDGTPKGEPFKVKSDGHMYNSHTHEFTINGWGGSEQYDLYESYEVPRKGDTVKILGISKYGLNYIGKTGVVDVVNFFNEGWTSVDPTEEGLSIGLYLPEQLEIIEEETTLAYTFKVGDKVRVHAAANGRYNDLFDGAEGVIEAIDSHYEEMYRVFSPEADDYDRFTAKDIELIVVAPVEFKVGDKVEVLDASKGRFADQQDGAIGTISHIGSNGIRVSISGDFDRYPADALRKVVEPTTYQIGDEVVIKTLDYVGNKTSAAAEGFYVGDRVTITGLGVGGSNEFTITRGTAVGYASAHHFGAAPVTRTSDSAEFEGFKVGDIGTVVKNFGGHSFSIGDQVRIYSIVDYGGNRMRGELLDGTKKFTDYFYGNEIEKAPEATAAKVPKAELLFEEGDLIRITNKDAIDGAYDTTNGKTYEITEVDEDGDITIMDDDNDTLCILRREFGGIEKVEGDLFAQFQPGDKVTLVSGGGAFPLSGFKNGSEYEVRNNDFGHSEGRLIQINKGDSYDNGYAKPSQLKKVEATPKAPKFSIGDKAILTSDDGAATMGFRIGEEVTITAGKRGGINDYEIRNTSTIGFASDRHLTAVVPAALKVAKEGDFIEIDFDFVGGNFSFVDITEGKAYKVETSEYTGSLVFKDDVGDNRGQHIKQGAYTVVDAPPVVMKATVESEYQFVQGDFVRFTDAEELDCADYITTGNVYEVIREDSPGFFIKDDEGDEIYIGGYESPYYEKVDAPVRKLQVGDIVRIDREEGNRGHSNNEEGDIGLITEVFGDHSRVQVSRHESHGNNEFNEDLTLIVANENREDKK